MKKYLLAIPLVLYPYSAFGALVGFFATLNKTDSVVLAALFPIICSLIWLAALICTVLIAIFSAVKKEDPTALSKLNMIIKLIHIPAYFLLFIMGMLLSMGGMFLGIFLPLVMFLDWGAICLSGTVGAVSASRAKADGMLTTGKAVIFGIMQFIYCFDVIFSIVLFVKILLVNRKRKRLSQQAENDL